MTADATQGASEALDQLALLVVRNLPQGLFVALAAFVLALILKDFFNGFSRRPFLNPDSWQPLTLVDIKQLSHNTKRFRFALPHPEQALGLPLGQHISIKATDNEGNDVLRWVLLGAGCWRSVCAWWVLPGGAAHPAVKRAEKGAQAVGGPQPPANRLARRPPRPCPALLRSLLCTPITQLACRCHPSHPCASCAISSDVLSSSLLAGINRCHIPSPPPPAPTPLQALHTHH